jgi:hypothetical protein
VDDRERRVRWLFRPRDDVLENVDVALLDPRDEDDRRLLIAAEHPRFWKAIEDGTPEIEVGGETVNAELHLAVHQVVAARILEDTFPEFWQTAQRLTRSGYRRHDVLHMLGSVVSSELYQALAEQPAISDDDIRTALRRLPGDNPPRRTTTHAGRHGRR